MTVAEVHHPVGDGLASTSEVVHKNHHEHNKTTQRIDGPNPSRWGGVGGVACTRIASDTRESDLRGCSFRSLTCYEHDGPLYGQVQVVRLLSAPRWQSDQSRARSPCVIRQQKERWIRHLDSVNDRTVAANVPALHNGRNAMPTGGLVNAGFSVFQLPRRWPVKRPPSDDYCFLFLATLFFRASFTRNSIILLIPGIRHCRHRLPAPCSAR
jgi:hypothetical protein